MVAGFLGESQQDSILRIFSKYVQLLEISRGYVVLTNNVRVGVVNLGINPQLRLPLYSCIQGARRAQSDALHRVVSSGRGGRNSENQTPNIVHRRGSLITSIYPLPRTRQSYTGSRYNYGVGLSTNLAIGVH